MRIIYVVFAVFLMALMATPGKVANYMEQKCERIVNHKEIKVKKRLFQESRCGW